MKLSLAWIFDHIDADWKQQSVDEIIKKFNQVTAEIEGHYRVCYDLSNFFIGKVIESSGQHIILQVNELNKELSLPLRTDVVDGNVYMVKHEGDAFRWATRAEFSTEKEGLLPAFSVDEKDMAGGWKNKFESEDVILEVDNKSITHRPDMWGHRGFAREIAAFMHLPFKPVKDFLKEHRTHTVSGASQQTITTPITIENNAPEACFRFTGLYFNSIERRASDLKIASRLLKVDMSPISMFVDLTNYVMLDWSQPMHAYDASKVTKQHVIIRMANPEEKLTLLGGDQITLTEQDLVIADSKVPMCLAGVKGGLDSSVTDATQSLFLEAATFDPGTIRRSAQRHKTRTDGSARHEKTLDPNQTTESIKRFLFLLDSLHVQAQYADEIISIGSDAHPHQIEVSHDFLEQRSGIKFSSDTVISILVRLEFKVLKSADEHGRVIYLISIPSFRATKDVKIKEDILEEIVRCYGFEKIPLQLPHIQRTPFSLRPINRLEKIKHYLSRAALMTEQQNYSLFDEQFISSLGYNAEPAVALLNPISENYRCMVTSLIPGLLKNVVDNNVHHDVLSFFECARVWKKPVTQEAGNDLSQSIEHKSVAGVFFKKRSTVDFYESKKLINDLFQDLGFDASQLSWSKIEKSQEPWYRPYQSTVLMYDNKTVGYAGKIDPMLLSKLDIGTDADAFIFELDGDFLLHEAAPSVRYHRISKFQDTYVDVSLFVPLAMTTDTLQNLMKNVSDLIVSIELVDFFEKEGADTTRALTFRLWLEHEHKTLEKAEIDNVWKSVVETLQKQNVTVRM